MKIITPMTIFINVMMNAIFLREIHLVKRKQRSSVSPTPSNYLLLSHFTDSKDES